MKLSKIFIYPIKSLGGISVQSANVEERGLQYDRRWMLIDEDNQFITQRTHPQMSLLNVEISKEGLEVSHKIESIENLDIPFDNNDSAVNVTVWDDNCLAQTTSKEIDDWFSEALEVNCKLVYMPDTTERIVDPRYVSDKKIVGFADGYPFLIIGQSSLDLLNSKLDDPVPMNRFRPNFVFTGGEPHDEDNWNQFNIGSTIFNAVKPCSRCLLTTVNQDTGIKGKEPLSTLSKYRSVNNKVLFGQNLVCTQKNRINIGDKIEVLNYIEKTL